MVRQLSPGETGKRPAVQRRRPAEVREPLQEQVHGHLRLQLMSGAYAPGQTITLRSLARELGTSTMPVREALGRLLAEHALEAMPNRSFRVPQMTASLLDDLHDIRLALEGRATGYACLRLTGRQLDRLDALCDEMAACIDDRDVQGYMTCNHAFHFTIYEASGRRALVRMIESVWLQCGPFLHLIFDEAGLAEVPEVHHREAAAALRARDAAGARAAIERDISEAARYYVSCGKLPAAEAASAR